MRRSQARKVLRRSRVDWVLGAMVVAAFVLVVHDAVHAHAPKAWRENMIFQTEWLGGVPTAAAFLVGTISGFIARRQFAFSVAPLLRYSSGYRTESKLGLDQSSGRLWCVDVSNTSRGVAIVTDISYDVELVDPPLNLGGIDFHEMLRAVQATGFRDEQDFVLDNWTRGTSVRNGEDRRLWEITDPVRAKIRRLVAHLTYASDLGERFETHVSAIPDR